MSNNSWGLTHLTLSTLYKTLIGSVIDYAFPCLNLLSNENIRRLQVIQNTAIRRILKIKLETPLETLHHLAFQKLKLNRIENRLFYLNESYVRSGLKNFTPLVMRLIKEYKAIFGPIEISNLATTLCSLYLTIDENPITNTCYSLTSTINSILFIFFLFLFFSFLFPFIQPSLVSHFYHKSYM